MANNVVKILRFRLIDVRSLPLAFATITAKLTPILTNNRNANTIFPTTISARTNELGFAEMTLYANDVLETNSKYLITVSYNGKNYYFLIKLTQDMNDVLDFEDLIDRSSLEKLANCSNPQEGSYKLVGEKYYF